jgi:polyhydroxyalkanoate synthesis regulator phasin
MARRRKGKVDTFGLSFLDVICCGFGAVILFYAVISAQAGVERTRRTEDLAAEVNKLDEQVKDGILNLAVLKNTMEETQKETVSAAGRADRIIKELEEKREQLSVYDASTVARRSAIEKLKADIKSLEEGVRRLKAGTEQEGPRGQETQSFRKEGGKRTYITGLSLRGQRILVLVDRSASMLHQDLVSVIRLRNSSEGARREAAKWRRAVDTVSWLVTQLPPGSKYQVYGFNTKTEALLPDSQGKWHEATDAPLLARNLEALRATIPQNGTSLINAFAAAKAMNPVPDQIILITDGLPTQGKEAGFRKYIDAGGRSRLFDDAVGALPDGVPVDIVLLPMKGDVPAAHRFWRLARLTQGVLLMPSKDWP